ncbi:MAG: TonB-dependent receptor [Prevotellaceae bacterium]|jgi:iron complex outermembrane receptor protein|nr:TonB-dependent receptor [Prevotellaceae bacterium]
MRKKTKFKRYDFCFRRWTRKAYGAFASMHKVVKVGVIQACFSIVTMNLLTVFAQDTLSTVRTLALDEVVVTGQREDALPSVVRSIAVVTRTEVEAAPAPTLYDLLRATPTLDLRQRGPLATQADLSIRGGTFDQTQILLNGVNFTDPQTGHHSLNIPVDMAAIASVEVMQGLSAPGAIGGAVNIATAGRALNTMDITLEGGKWGYSNLSGNATVGNKRLQAFVSASHRQSEGYIENTDFRTANFFTHARYVSTAGRFEAQLGYQDKDFGSHGFYSFKYPDQFEHTRTALGSLRWQHTVDAFNFSATAYYRRHNDRFELVRGTATGRNDHQTRVGGGELTAGYHSLAGYTALSAEFRNEQIYSTVLGKDRSPKPAPFEHQVFFTKEASRKLFRGLLSHAYTYRKFTGTAGVSYHYSNDFDGKFCVAADVRYRWTTSFYSYAAVNRSLRLPTFTDLYYKTATHEANPNLKPEESLTYELGTAYATPVFKTSAAFFYRQGKNLIDWVYMQGMAKSQSLNYTSLNAMGAEWQLQWTPAAANRKSFVQCLSLGYGFTGLDKSADNEASSYLLDYLKHKANLTVEHLLFLPCLKASWQLGVQDRAGNYVDIDTGETKPFGAFALLDLRLSWETRHTALFAEAHNLFNTHYFDYAGLVQPGVWLMAGVRVKIGG